MSDNEVLHNVFKIGLLGLSTLGTLFLTKVCIDESKKHSEEMKKVKQAFHKIQEYEPEELVEKLEGLYKKEKGSGKYIDCGKFFVKGVISCDSPIPSFKDHDVKLIFSNLYKYDLVATVNQS